MTTPPSAHWRYVPTPTQPDRWEYADGDWVYAQDPATSAWGWQWVGAGTPPAAPTAAPPSAHPMHTGTWPPVTPTIPPVQTAQATPPHWRYAPDAQYVDGNWVYSEDPATHTWAWRPLAGATPTGAPPAAPPPNGPHGHVGVWPPTPPPGPVGPVTAVQPMPAAVGQPQPAAGAQAHATSRSSFPWLAAIIAAVLVVLLILGALTHWRFGFAASVGNPGTAPGVSATAGTGNGSTNGGSGSTNNNGASPAPSSSSAPAGTSSNGSTGLVGDHCNTVPSLNGPWEVVQTHPTANTTLAERELQVIAANGAQGADYAGKPVSDSDLQAWVHTAQCDGLASTVELSQFWRQSDGSMRAAVNAVNGQQAVHAWVLGMNDLGLSFANNADAAAKVTQLANEVHRMSGKPVWCLVDFMSASDAQMFKSGCDLVLPGYYPWKHSAKYGPVNQLVDVGALAQAVNGGNASEAFQMFAWSDDPADASALGFFPPNDGLPRPCDVRSMVKLGLKGGAVNAFMVTLEGRHAGTDEDDLSWLGQSVKAVSTALGNQPCSCN